MREKAERTHLGMELLLRTSVTEGARIAGVTKSAVQPLIRRSYGRTRCATVEVAFRHPPFVLPIVVVGARVSLSAHARRLTTRLRLVARHHMKHIYKTAECIITYSLNICDSVALFCA